MLSSSLTLQWAAENWEHLDVGLRGSCPFKL